MPGHLSTDQTYKRLLANVAALLLLNCGAPAENAANLHLGGMSDAMPPEDASVDAYDATSTGPHDASVPDVHVPNDAHMQPDVVHTVLPCSSLSAVGTWEQITPPCGDLKNGYGTQAFVVDPLNAGTVYVGYYSPDGATGCGIWKTKDCGATWSHINTGANGASIDGANHWTIAIDPVDSQVIYTANGYGVSGVFKSTNGGVDWTQILPANIASVFIDNGFVERITIDPTNHLHLLVSPHFTCQNGHTQCLLESMDGGATWTILDGAPSAGEDSGQIMLDSNTWLYAGTSGLYRTSNAGMSWTQVFPDWIYDSVYKTVGGTYLAMSAQDGVLQSTDTIKWTAIPNSPSNARALIGDGTSVFTSSRNVAAPYHPYSFASESNPTNWATYPSPLLPNGGWLLGYDSSHHILYASTESNGFWRVVTK